MFWPGVTEVPNLRYRRLFHYAAISTMDGAQPISPAFAQLPRNRALGSGGSSSGWIVGHPEVGAVALLHRSTCCAIPRVRSGLRGGASAYLRRFCHHVFASVADRISTPPATELAAGRSRAPSPPHTTPALPQPHPHRVQRGFQEQDGGGLEGRHMTDGARHEQVSQSDLKYAEIEEHSEIEQARVRWGKSLR